MIAVESQLALETLLMNGPLEWIDVGELLRLSTVRYNTNGDTLALHSRFEKNLGSEEAGRADDAS